MFLLAILEVSDVVTFLSVVPWVAIAIAGSSIIGAAANADSVDSTNSANARLAKQSQQWQSAENEKSRQFTTSERLAQQQWQAGMLQTEQQNALDMLRLEQSFQRQQNDPAYQAQRLKAAGINPAVYFGGHSTAQYTSPTGSVPSAPSAPSGASASMQGAPNLIAQQPVNFTNSIRDLASSVQMFAEAEKSGVDVTRIKGMTEHEIKSLILKNMGQEYTNQILQAQAAFDQVNLPNKVQLAFADYMLKCRQVENARTEGELMKSEKELNQMKSRLTDETSRLTLTQRLVMDNVLENWDTQFQADMELKRSEMRKNNAETSGLLQDNRVKKIVADVRESGKSDEAIAWLRELHAKSMLSQEELNKSIQEIERLEHLDNRTEFAKRLDAALTRVMRNLRGLK